MDLVVFDYQTTTLLPECAMLICVVHLRRPIGPDGIEKQRNQYRALRKWAMRHRSGDPKAKLVILAES